METNFAGKESGMPEKAGQLYSPCIPIGVVTSRFYFTLLNQDPQLDLRKFGKEVINAIDKIRSGGNTGHSYSNINWIDLIILSKDTIELDVEMQYEDDAWVKNFPKLLVKENPKELRPYCKKSDPSRLFKVTRR